MLLFMFVFLRENRGVADQRRINKEFPDNKRRSSSAETIIRQHTQQGCIVKPIMLL